jgi:hypothetical protein
MARSVAADFMEVAAVTPDVILNPMTKVQKTFSVTRPLTESDLLNIARMHSVYGFLAVRWKPSNSELFIEYDASRLTPSDVRLSLEEHGLPVSATASAG